MIKIPENGYHFNKEGIRKIEEMKSATYMGYWATKNPHGGWNETPVDVFYVENPDRSLGHSNYFGMFVQGGKVYINNAESAFSEPIAGIHTRDGTAIVSRYRHDYVERGGCMIDGGRDYTRTSGHPVVYFVVDGPNFKIKE